jgi:NADPH-dependent ferric siderophore reductase
MKNNPPKQLTVVHSEQVTENMQRIVLHSDSLVDFPQDCAGNYIKLLFNNSGGTDLSMLAEDQHPIKRTYSIRRFSPSLRTIEIDFVRHSNENLQCGFASRWAINVNLGETINIYGPGTMNAIVTDTDWFFMVADMTALPALSAQVSKLPQNAKGYAVIKVLTTKDIQPLETPANLHVIWLTKEQSLAKKVQSLPWLAGTVSVWSACEFDSMRVLRDYFRNEKDVQRENIYISSYWKQGVTEDGHKIIKRQDAQEMVIPNP